MVRLRFKTVAATALAAISFSALAMTSYCLSVRGWISLSLPKDKDSATEARRSRAMAAAQESMTREGYRVSDWRLVHESSGEKGWWFFFDRVPRLPCDTGESHLTVYVPPSGEVWMSPGL
jgi:hypothetical protein